MAEQLVQHAMLVDVTDGSHELRALAVPEIIGPVDFGWAMQQEGDYLCIGSGILAGSIIPGSNRLIVTGQSPVWGGFYVSTIGGAALLWDGTGISFLGITGRAERPSVLVLRGRDGRYPSMSLVPVDLDRIWNPESGPRGFYALQAHAFDQLWDGVGTPRVLAVGPAARSTTFGAIGSSKTRAGKLTAVDCWAGRGGFGSQLLQRHNLCAIVYGGDYEDDDLTDRAEADGAFEARFSKKMKLVDLEATTKYRFDPRWHSGGTFGVNYARLDDLLLSFNYRSTAWTREKRHQLWARLVRDHYLEQFNRETIAQKQQSHCGEPCPAVCKKLHGEYKKDYEPYQAMGPLMGVFDQRAAEQLNHHADALGFDGIQIGGQLAWLMECLHDGLVQPAELGLAGDVPGEPRFEPDDFDPVADSQHNARMGLALLELSATPGHLLSKGMRYAADALGSEARDRAVYLSNGPDGWMVPNQYWVPGMFGPQCVMGKYYVYYKGDFLPPRELGRKSAERMLAELATDNAGLCRFHRGWSEQLWSELVQRHFNVEIDYPGHHHRLAQRLHHQGQPIYWQSARIEQIIHGYLRDVAEDLVGDAELDGWLTRFEADRHLAARSYWEQMRLGIEEGLAKER